MVESRIPGRLRSDAKARATPQTTLRRYGRRQLLKQKASTEPNEQKSFGAESEHETEEVEDGKVDDKEGDTESSPTGSNSIHKGKTSNSTSKSLAHEFAIEFTYHGTAVDESREGSRVGPAAAQLISTGLDKLCDSDAKKKDSGSKTALGEDLYYIEAIKSSRIDKNGKFEFLIKWEGYEKKSDLTWEPERTLIDSAPEILKDYFSAIGGRDTIGKKRKRGRPCKIIPASQVEKKIIAKKQKLESDPVIDNVKQARNNGEGTFAVIVAVETEAEEVGDDGKTFWTPVQQRNQVLESFRKGLDNLGNSPDLSADEAEVELSELDATGLIISPRKETTMKDVRLSKANSSHLSLRPVHEIIEQRVSTFCKTSAVEGSDYIQRNTGHALPSVDQDSTGKVSTKNQASHQDHASSDEKKCVEGTARLRALGHKSRLTGDHNNENNGDGDMEDEAS